MPPFLLRQTSCFDPHHTYKLGTSFNRCVVLCYEDCLLSRRRGQRGRYSHASLSRTHTIDEHDSHNTNRFHNALSPLGTPQNHRSDRSKGFAPRGHGNFEIGRPCDDALLGFRLRASIYVGITTLTVPDTPTVSAYHSNVLDFLKCHIILKAINRSKNAFRSLNVSILREQLDVTRIASSRDLETVRDLSTHRAQYDCYLLPIPHFCLHWATRLRVGPRINVLPDDLSHPFNLDSVILYCGLFGVVPTTCLTSILEPFSLDQVKLHYSAAANFFAPRTRRKLPTQSYARIERPQFNPQNPARARPDPSTTPAPSSPPPTGKDTIVCAPPGHPDCESDDDMPDADTSEPPLNSTGSHMTLAEKARLIKKWADNKQKHVRKKRDKNSHEAIDRSFYSEYKDGPKIFQEFRWTCIECLQNPSTLRKIFQVLESNRRGVTSGMGDHLKSHSITKESHHGRINGYGRAIGGGDYTEVDAWSGRPRQRARLTAKESIRQWFTPAFQEMFLAHNTTYFVERREKLKIELQYNCATISLTLDIWTAPNRLRRHLRSSGSSQSFSPLRRQRRQQRHALLFEDQTTFQFPGKLVDGVNIPSLFVYMLICVQARILLLNPLLRRKFPPRLLPRLPPNLLPPKPPASQADKYNGGFGGLRLYKCVTVYNRGFERVGPIYFEDSAELLKVLIFGDSFKLFMNGLNWPKPNLNRENWSLKILNQDPKNSIHLIHPSFKIFKKFTFVYHPYVSRRVSYLDLTLLPPTLLRFSCRQISFRKASLREPRLASLPLVADNSSCN
ncbi:hypothetical protein HRG_014913 [Hirsutella rhossiliensis]